MKTFAVIVTSIAILTGIAYAAYTLEPDHVKDMTCKITIKDTKSCTGTPTLQHGVLKISKDGSFEIRGRYDACFFFEDVTITGKSKVNVFHNGVSFELLATNTIRGDTASDHFPRTLGFVSFNKDTLEGHLIDISAVIRSRGRSTKDIVAAKIYCELNK